MNALVVLLFVIHVGASLALAGFGYHRLTLAIRYQRLVRHRLPRRPAAGPVLPTVTVQIPLYNEQYVAERVITAVAALDYPRSLLEVQVLDDSTDETSVVVRRTINRLHATGLNVEHLRRRNRVGFKAGALAHGLRHARGELIAIFDADFVPPTDFLTRLVDEFTDPAVGMVQARWEHLNAESSMLTKVQSLQLDAHFTIEQGVRCATGCFFNFNGTAGVWRKLAIESSGGWRSDTLTEDLDLSYRAQLKGWRFVYRDDVAAPAELPVEFAGYRVQQQRWAQGGVQTAFKLVPLLLRAPLQPRVKRESFWHLTAHMAYPILVTLAVAGLSLGWVAGTDYRAWLYGVDGFLLTFATLSIAFYYGVAGNARRAGAGTRRLKMIPALMLVGAGVALSQSAAVARGILGIRTPFLRTPKYNHKGAGDRTWKSASYRIPGLGAAIVDCLAGLAVLSVGITAMLNHVVVPPGPVALFGGGFLLTGTTALTQHGRSRIPRPQPAQSEVLDKQKTAVHDRSA